MANPPAGLKGKSTVLKWAENRVQRPAGHGEFRPVTINMELAIYVSSEGRVFNRMRSNSGASEQAPAGPPVPGDRVTSFAGSTMTVTQPLRGLTRKIVISFEGGVASCKVDISVAKHGAQNGFIRAFGTGVDQEVQSIAVSGTSCAVRNGNIFQN